MIPTATQANRFLLALRCAADKADALTIHGIYDTAPGHVQSILGLTDDLVLWCDDADRFVAAPEPEYTRQHWLEDQAELTEGNEE